jgi:hypothetical protein
MTQELKKKVYQIFQLVEKGKLFCTSQLIQKMLWRQEEFLDTVQTPQF